MWRCRGVGDSGHNDADTGTDPEREGDALHLSGDPTGDPVPPFLMPAFHQCKKVVPSVMKPHPSQKKQRIKST
jgi:hypothetical protein